MKFVFSPDVILCGRLGSKHQLTNLISMACILLRSSSVRVHDSQAYTTRDVTRGRISRILSSDTTDATMIYLALYCIRSPQWSESVVDCREDTDWTILNLVSEEQLV